MSYLEIAIDFLFKDTWDLLIHRPGVQSSFTYFAGKIGPSRYAGARKSTTRLVAYMKDKPVCVGGDVFTSNRVRIELRKRYLGCSPLTLGELPNQFTNVRLYSVTAAEALEDHQMEAWPSFLHSAKQDNVASALAKFPHQRKQIHALLDKCRVPWWTPEQYMANWKQTVARLRLSLVQAVESE